MNLKLQTVQPEFLAKLLQDVETFKVNVDDFVDDYTEKSVSITFDVIRIACEPYCLSVRLSICLPHSLVASKGKHTVEA